MKANFIDIILIVLFFQLLSLTPYLLFHGGKRSTSNRLLALFLCSYATPVRQLLGGVRGLFQATYDCLPSLQIVQAG